MISLKWSRGHASRHGAHQGNDFASCGLSNSPCCRDRSDNNDDWAFSVGPERGRLVGACAGGRVVRCVSVLSPRQPAPYGGQLSTQAGKQDAGRCGRRRSCRGQASAGATPATAASRASTSRSATPPPTGATLAGRNIQGGANHVSREKRDDRLVGLSGSADVVE